MAWFSTDAKSARIREDYEAIPELALELKDDPIGTKDRLDKFMDAEYNQSQNRGGVKKNLFQTH